MVSKFPGEKHGAPELLMVHDLSHILSGNGTDIPGEMRTVMFQAGCRRENVYGNLFFVLLMGQHGVRVSPLAEPASNLLATPGLASDLIRSFARGNRMNIDLFARWD